ncbi:MAG TPA: hypothetical protein VNE63_03565 [Candidatus Acidoferrales bacterium]|nr:hypothetical protein [Candidatus Acidoferrales bacterium]
MRGFLILGLGCVLVIGCASPSPPQKPSPYRYAQIAPLLTLGAYEKELP